MRVLKRFSVLCASITLSACSIHPLPEDFSRSDTFEIVQKIRCEAKEAIISVALTDEGRGQIDAFLSEADARKQAPQSRLDKARRLLLPKLQQIAIGYTFKFSITEGNDASGAATFEMPFSNGSFSLGLNVGEDKKRKSERSFDLVESFAKVISDASLDCAPGGKNWKYPITGEVGLKEVISTYVRLANLALFPAETRSSSREANVSRGGSRPSGGGDTDRNGGNRSGQSRKVYEFTDELTFTTTYNASVEPSLQLRPVAHDFRLTRASASIGGRREDVHSLTVALAPADDKESQARASVPALRNQLAIQEIGQAPPANSAETNALSILQNKRSRELRFPSE